MKYWRWLCERGQASHTLEACEEEFSSPPTNLVGAQDRLIQAATVRAAIQPKPCGYWGDPTKECTCIPATITRYQKRISGPLLDRVDTLRA